jgi:hypothetical protein
MTIDAEKEVEIKRVFTKVPSENLVHGQRQMRSRTVDNGRGLLAGSRTAWDRGTLPEARGEPTGEGQGEDKEGEGSGGMGRTKPHSMLTSSAGVWSGRQRSVGAGTKLPPRTLVLRRTELDKGGEEEGNRTGQHPDNKEETENTANQPEGEEKEEKEEKEAKENKENKEEKEEKENEKEKEKVEDTGGGVEGDTTLNQEGEEKGSDASASTSVSPESDKEGGRAQDRAQDRAQNRGRDNLVDFHERSELSSMPEKEFPSVIFSPSASSESTGAYENNISVDDETDSGYDSDDESEGEDSENK